MTADCKVQIVRDGAGDLEREVWEFMVMDFPRVVLESHMHERRESKRHKWVAYRGYMRLAFNRYSVVKWETTPPEVPEDVVTEALDVLAERLVFKKGTR